MQPRTRRRLSSAPALLWPSRLSPLFSVLSFFAAQNLTRRTQRSRRTPVPEERPAVVQFLREADMKPTQAELGRKFLDLHRGPKILVLPNAWDAASARIFEQAGFPAIGTSSAGVAFALGYPDGQNISRDEMLGVVRRIAETVEVPVTADVEAGFGTSPKEVADTARAVIAAGAVGMNLEDGIDGKPEFIADLGRQKETIRAVLEAATSTGVPFVLNARTD